MTATSEMLDVPEYSVPQGVVVDFDRTLADVDVSVQRLHTVASYFGVSKRAIEEAQAHVENDGGSFSPLALLTEELDQDQYKQFLNAYITYDGPPILYSDAIPFLNRLETAGIPYTVLTYGASKLWQKLKIAASGYAGGIDIMGHPDKGSHIARWKRSGTYDFEAMGHEGALYRADSISLVDDKPVAFERLASDCTGFLIRRDEGLLLPSQSGVVRNGIEVITSLDELVVAEGRLLRLTDPTEIAKVHASSIGERLLTQTVYRSCFFD